MGLSRAAKSTQRWLATLVPFADAGRDGGFYRVWLRLPGTASPATLSLLTDYPPTTATDSAGLKPGQRFRQTLPQPVKAWAVRVASKPACGDNPRQAFSSCGELEAF